ncbi:MAG: DUF373 family protein [Candidatus Diapherotrites archaeon]|jgi:putative membrane protein|uniref:DUF373 family protein n=1 Tax=Candidatus Iainarchaeum sp. TaxID=3101447 RepID=A0A8T5GGA6_9ARCH|nr:DUF373 family protein [Candidatus Diapherotrites archaeon]MBT7241762.1 DUF373 family protein [Candidatus Diapherotrites archaeon]
MKKKVFVVCVDRDNDLGRKTRFKGPVIGREKNLEAGQKLILADPTESDANTIFASIKKMEEAKKEFKNVEVVTITGKDKTALRSDKEINRQLDIIQKNYNVEGWILVTDGAEDAQVIPLLQSRAKIISTEQVIIRQAQAVESTFYTIKEAFRDPSIARMFIGIPGILLLLFASLWFFYPQYILQTITLVLGAYLLLKGFGIEDKIMDMFKNITSSISEQRISVVFYVAAFIFPLFGIWLAYIQLISSNFIDIGLDVISSLRLLYPFLAAAVISIIVAKGVDSIYAKKAYKIGKYFVQIVSIVALWAILDAGTLVFLSQADLAWFPANIMASFIILIIALRIGNTFDIRAKVTRILIGLHVSDEEGNYLGRVKEVNKRRQSITYGKKNVETRKKDFILKDGRIIILN